MSTQQFSRPFVALLFLYLSLRSFLGFHYETGPAGTGAMIGSIVGGLLGVIFAYEAVKNPSKWGRGIGYFLLFVVLMRVLFWSVGTAHLRQTVPGYRTTYLSFVVTELCCLIAMIMCFRFRPDYESVPNQSTDPTLASGTSGAEHQPRHP
jgi:hypothetical protein